MPRDEIMVTIAPRGDGETLEGLYLSGSTQHGALVAPPHPLYGGSMDSPVVGEVAYAAAQSDMHALRFNWRGVGASAGRPSGDADDADEDYASGLDHLAETVTGDLVACGYSFGSVAALRIAAHEPRVRGLVLIAPPPSYFPDDAIAALDRPVLVLVGERDDIAPPAELEKRCAAAPRAALEVIEGTDHFFMAGLSAIGRESRRWFSGWVHER